MCIEHVFVKSFILDCSFVFVLNRNIINYTENYLQYQDNISYYDYEYIPLIHIAFNKIQNLYLFLGQTLSLGTHTS